MNLPVTKEAYYGPSEIMQSIPEEYFNTYRAAYYYVLGGKYTAEASIGEITKAVPITVKTVDGDVAAQITAFRADVEGMADLAEEVVRMYGLDNKLCASYFYQRSFLFGLSSGEKRGRAMGNGRSIL